MTITLGMLFAGVVAIAASLWLEFRRLDRRNRLVKSIETVLKNEDISQPDEVPFKRAA